ncbi:P protein [Rockfish nackednavirus]|nr:P protein [Rockfish nackednavirus]
MEEGRLRTMFDACSYGKILLKHLEENPQNHHHSKTIARIVAESILKETSKENPLKNGDNHQGHPPDPSPVLHHLGDDLLGLYEKIEHCKFNKEWIIPEFEDIHLEEGYFKATDSEDLQKWAYPLRIWHGKHQLPVKHLDKGVAPHYESNPDHIVKVKQYMDSLYKAGILYKRKSRNVFEVDSKVQLFPWERNNHRIKVKGQIKNRCHGHSFCVDKNSNDSESCRLVVDMSGSSRLMKAQHIKMPKYFTPSLSTLLTLFKPNLWYMSLDLKSAFYSFPVHPESAVHLLISDTKNVYGFRKLPMGHWISPFVLQMYTARLCTYIRKKYKIRAYAYMDDIMLAHKHPKILRRVTKLISKYINKFGLRLNVDKSTPEPVREAKFIGVLLQKGGIAPQRHHWERSQKVLQLIKNIHFDFKILQKVTGQLNWTSPFTPGGLAPLLPLYKRASKEWSTKIPDDMYNLIEANWSKPINLHYNTKKICKNKCYADASLTHIGLVYTDHQYDSIEFKQCHNQCHINHKELIAAIYAADTSKCVITDSSYVYYKKFYKNFSPILVNILQFIFKSADVYWISTLHNPADAPSRNRPPDRRAWSRAASHVHGRYPRTRRDYITKLLYNHQQCFDACVKWEKGDVPNM